MLQRWHVFAEYAAFQGVWLVSVMGAASGTNVPGVAAAGLFVVVCLAAKRWSHREIALILASGAIGSIAETCLAATGIIRFGAASGILAPPWIIALWVAFGATLSVMAGLLRNPNVFKSAVIGGVFGPLAYAGGERIGAMTISGSAIRAYAAVALVWAVALPALFWLQSRLYGRSKVR